MPLTSDRTSDPTRLRQLGRNATNLALRAILRAHELLGVATGLHLRETRAQDDPLRHQQARVEEAELRARLAWEAVEMLRARLAKVPERHRPHYTPTQRFRILEIKRFLAWTLPETAEAFLLWPGTVASWERQVRPGVTTVGVTVRPAPPVVRMSDAVRSLVQAMSRLGFGSGDLIAQTLVRAGWRLSARTVGRIVREPLRPSPTPDEPRRPQRPVRANFVHHVWMADVSEVRAFLGSAFYMATIFDACSRVPLAFQTLDRKPRSLDMARLLRRAVRAFGKPRHVITDLGPEFRGAFSARLRRLGVAQRFRRQGYVAGTARLESFWRTLKNSASLRLPLFLTLEDLERRLAPALVHYICFRPHHGLKGATPAEVFLGLEPARVRAQRAPRGRPGEGSLAVPFRIEMLAPHEQRFPVLVPAAA